MEVEQLEIREYLAKCPPLIELPGDSLDEVTQSLEIQYARRDSVVLNVGDNNHNVFLVRSGAVEVLTEGGDLIGRFTEGEWVGYRSVMRGGKVSMTVKAIEDTLFYTIPGDLFLKLLKDFEKVGNFFSAKKPERLRNAIQEIRSADDGYEMIAMQVSELMKLPMLVGQQDSIQQVARQMSDFNAQTAMVTDDSYALNGIVTDVDFRKRVVAEGLGVDLPISEIMTHNPLTLDPTDRASDALLLMARRNIRHVPITENGEVVGVISATDLLRSQSHNAIYLVGDIFAATEVSRLAELSKTLPRALVGLVSHSLPAYDIGHAITSIGQAITRRLLVLAEEKFGPPPIPYAYIVAGSMARREQTAHSDQDNCMILSDEYDPQKHGEYFLAVAKFVSDALHECGYIYCPGDVMATNDKWRQPLSVWRNYFHDWIENPQPKALMYASIFFDLRCLHGEEELLISLQNEILQKTKKQTLFQAFMAGNALSHKPPLGFFRGFVLDKAGNDEKGMNMKKRGVVPVIDMVRLFSLASGLPQINTWERMDAIAAEGKVLQQSTVDDLRDAFEFISMVRLQHQAAQIEKGQEPNNYVPPEELSALERRHLKDAFEVISSAQDSMASRYQADRFR